MKTSKILMIVTVFAIAMMSSSITSHVNATPTTKTVVQLNITEAIQNAGLVKAMYEQLNPNFLELNMQVYTQVVYHNNVIWVISGTANQWELFFRARVLYVKLDVD